MARSKKLPTPDAASTPAAPGHNGPVPLTEDEAAALTTHFALKVIADQRVADQKKADLDAAKATVNGHFKLISKELGITRQDFEREVIAVLGMNETQYLNAEKKRDRLHRLAGVKSGEQLDLVEHVLKDSIDEALVAEQDGYRAGRRADGPFPPENIAPGMQTDWMRGYHMGQGYNGAQLQHAHEILNRPKPGTMVAPEEPEGDEHSPEALKAAAKKLEAEGWTEPTADEQQFEEKAA